MTGADVYVRHTDKAGAVHVTHYRAWDKTLLLKSLELAAARENQDEKDPAMRKAKVERITAEQYAAAK